MILKDVICIMKKSVFLGNGINRCILSDVSWGDLLATIAQKHNVQINQNISFPMQFETLVNQVLMNSKVAKKDAYTEIKEEIMSLLETASLPENAPHKALADTADSIITTNYDFLIESGIDSNFSVKSIPGRSKDGNNKYNLRNSVLASGKEVFHIHGDLRRAQSICLGYEHYAGTVQHLRDAIAKKKDVGAEKVPAIVLALREPKNTTDTWAEKLFTDDIHIVGLGLTQSEIDIWWLITYRATLLYANRFNCRELINNKIVYHDISDMLDDNMKFTLENLGVEYVFHHIPEKTNEYFLQKYFEISNLI